MNDVVTKEKDDTRKIPVNKGILCTCTSMFDYCCALVDDQVEGHASNVIVKKDDITTRSANKGMYMYMYV